MNLIAISVAIPCYGSQERLQKVLEKIQLCDPFPDEILIHADGGWVPDFENNAYRGTQLKIICSQEKQGPGGGRDILLKIAKNELVASFDDDSWPIDADYFAEAKKIMDLFPQAVVLSPNVFVQESPITTRLPEVFSARAFEGSASITRKSHYLKLPGYVHVPEAYGVEEADVSLQAFANDFQILSSPWIRAWHDRPKSDDQHGVEPWIRNEVLLGHLRYPLWLQPLAWSRAIRHIIRHRHTIPLWRSLKAFGESLNLCKEHSKSKKRYSLGQLGSFHASQSKTWKLEFDDTSTPKAVPLETRGRIVFVQYTNPGSYPPLEHASKILSRLGWEVLFLGAVQQGKTALVLPTYPRITVKNVALRSPGWKQRVHYLFYALWSLWMCFRFRADWVYASDPMSTIIARMLKGVLGLQVIYHEHDSPTFSPQFPAVRTDKFLMEQRKKLCLDAEIVILPNQKRLEALVDQTGRQKPSLCVWNVPISSEIPPPKEPIREGDTICFLYHGSINAHRFPMGVLQALKMAKSPVKVRLVGYETAGSKGYTQELRAEAERLGVSDRFEYLGTLPKREDLMNCCRECDVGLSLLSISDEDINMRHMVGASNKPFDYLSQGLALVVPPDPQWEAVYVSSECGVSCGIHDIVRLAELFDWFYNHPKKMQAMGERGRQLIAKSWNYESQFEPVLNAMQSH